MNVGLYLAGAACAAFVGAKVEDIVDAHTSHEPGVLNSKALGAVMVPAALGVAILGRTARGVPAGLAAGFALGAAFAGARNTIGEDAAAHASRH